MQNLMKNGVTSDLMILERRPDSKRSKRSAASRRLVDEARQGASCLFCGEDDPDVLDFHHTRDKLFHVSNGWRRYGTEKVRAELEKCVIVCANCHRKIHVGKLEVPSV